jgi:adenylate kinase
MAWVDGAAQQAIVSQCVTDVIKKAVESSKNAKLLQTSSTKVRPVGPLRVIIAGAPASGKGTQCEVIKQQFGLVHLSTGDILRAAVKEGTDLGLQAKAFMDSGKLVPDELIIGVICDRLKQEDCVKKGWLLDGFPRTKSQAEALCAAGMDPDCFLLLDVPEEILVERVTGRRSDPVTGKIYHMKFNPPENEEVAARLVQRSDDTADMIRVRYREFKANIDAVQACYEDKMAWVDGSASQMDVTACVVNALESVRKDAFVGV